MIVIPLAARAPRNRARWHPNDGFARRHVAIDKGIAAGRRARANRYRGAQYGFDTDERAVANHRQMLHLAVIVGGNRTRADIHLLANRRVTEITNMANQRVIANRVNSA